MDTRHEAINNHIGNSPSIHAQRNQFQFNTREVTSQKLEIRETESSVATGGGKSEVLDLVNEVKSLRQWIELS